MTEATIPLPNELQLIEAMSVLTLRPGDKLVLKIDAWPSCEMVEQIKATVRSVVGDYPLLILERGMDIGVLRQEQ